MVIEIDDTRKVHELQEQFSGRFPYLKLEFFHTPHDRGEPSNETPCNPEQSLGEIRSKHVHGVIAIDPHRETGSVEQEFERRFGLHVQIYRMQMDKWIQTTGTDMLTISMQNEIARDSVIFYNPDHEFQREEED